MLSFSSFLDIYLSMHEVSGSTPAFSMAGTFSACLCGYVCRQTVVMFIMGEADRTVIAILDSTMHHIVAILDSTIHTIHQCRQRSPSSQKSGIYPSTVIVFC